MHRTYKPDGRTIRSHIHYRLIIKEVCRGNITKFRDTKELITVLRDAMIGELSTTFSVSSVLNVFLAHQDAYNEAQLLNRDISVGNILITHDGHGLLGDWELSKLRSELGRPRQAERTVSFCVIVA